MVAPTTGIRTPDRRFRFWRREEIFDGIGPGQYIPNKRDLVIDEDQGFFLVTEVDYSTGLSTLKLWETPNSPDEDDNVGQLVGVGPGYVSESYRMFLDQTVTPHTLSPDSRLFFFQSTAKSYKVFRGSNITDADGDVISAFYDPSGNFLGTEVPLVDTIVPETIIQTGTIVDATAETIPAKMPMGGMTNESLQNGELVTVVAYSDDGGVSSIAQLVIVNTSAIRQSDAAKRYVNAIELDTPFISPADPELIEFPINVAVRSLPLTALVHYSDGSRVRHALDNGQFSLLGIDSYIATVQNQKIPMTLSYTLAEDEISYNLKPTANRRITRSYMARTVAADGAYEVKLYVFPIWVSAEVGYRLEYWLYNLDRQTYYNVTPNIELAVTSQPFNPTQYGTTQKITVAVDLNKVDGRFSPYRHVQSFRIALLTRGDQNRDNWQISMDGDNGEFYGKSPDGTQFKAATEFDSVNYYRLDITCGFTSLNQWLDNLYGKIEPLYDEQTETGPIRPTHFILEFVHNQYEYSVQQWSDTLVVQNDLEDGEVVYIRWLYKNVQTNLQLGVSALPVHQQN